MKLTDTFAKAIYTQKTMREVELCINNINMYEFSNSVAGNCMGLGICGMKTCSESPGTAFHLRVGRCVTMQVSITLELGHAVMEFPSYGRVEERVTASTSDSEYYRPLKQQKTQTNPIRVKNSIIIIMHI